MTSTSAAETWGGSNLHLAIQVDSVELLLLHSSPEIAKELLGNCKDEEFLNLSEKYLDDSHKTINFCATTVQEYLNSANNYLSLIQDGEGSSSGVNLNIYHHHFFHYLSCVYTQQLLMRDSLQSFQNGLAQMLHRAKVWKKVSVVAFAAFAVLMTSVSVVAAITRKRAIAVLAAAVPLLVATLERWINSRLSKYKNGLKKHVEITGVMAVGTKITINDLTSLYLSARQFEFQTKLASEMAESADAGEVKKELMKSFQELQWKATNFCLSIRSARAHTLQSVIKHLDSVTRDEVDNNGVAEADSGNWGFKCFGVDLVRWLRNASS